MNNGCLERDRTVLIVVRIGPRGSRYDTDADRKWPVPRFTAWVGRQIARYLSITRERFSLYVPIATSLVLSILLSLLVYILSWLFRR